MKELATDFKKMETDKSRDQQLRPLSFKDFSGQNDIKKKLEIFVSAAMQRKEPLDHTLLYGPPGLGKTTMARIISARMEVSFQGVSAPALRRKGDLASLLTTLKPKSILFIDEIHRLSREIEEYLYSAMEDFFIDVVTGEGMGAQSVRFKLPPFTLIGATTRTGLLTTPFRDRFGIIERLDFYQPEFLSKIIVRSARILKIEIDEPAAYELARRGRGTPRIVNHLLKRTRDYAQVEGLKKIDKKLACYALENLGIDEQGLNSMDRELLKLIGRTFEGGPVGIETLAACMQEEVDTLTDFCEPYLLREEFLRKTPRGRILTDKARAVIDSLEEEMKKSSDQRGSVDCRDS